MRAVLRDFAKLRQVYSFTQLIVGAALLLAGLSLTVVVVGDEGKLLDWFIQTTATFVAALLAFGGGIWLYRLQEQDREEKLEKRLAARVAVESQMNLWLLENKPTRFVDDRTGQQVMEGSVVGAMMSAAALTDLIRSNLLEPEDAMRTLDREGVINAHNAQMAVLLNARTSPMSSQAFRELIFDVSWRQENLRDDFKGMIRALREQGIEVSDYAQAIGAPRRQEERAGSRVRP